MEREEGGLDGVEAVAEGRGVRACGRSSIPLGCSWVPAVVCVHECVFIHVHGSVCANTHGGWRRIKAQPSPLRLTLQEAVLSTRCRLNLNPISTLYY